MSRFFARSAGLGLPGMAIAGAFVIAWAGPAAAVPMADADPASRADNRYCAVLVGKDADPDAPSSALAAACSDTSRDDARTKMRQAAERTAPRAEAASSDLLMTWFDDAHYNGSSTDIYGDSGPCDSAGYEIQLSTTWPWSWGNTISSAAGTETCDTADFISQSGTYARTFNLPVPYIGNTLNDNVRTIRVWND
ncbi:hypothetical protein [Allosalinactinospora lopnorensis]|uniref:hypothetical protein n=1 Tax=Allosalinactinospora lopnorensis TaxID=1352348 RepID=UPI000623EB83|nr:hypothetical protein [Allosalinactinospora lopnorensis]